MGNVLASQPLLSDLLPESGQGPRRFDALLKVGFDHQERYDDFAEWADAIKFACGLTRTVHTIGDESVEVPEDCTPERTRRRAHEENPQAQGRFYDTALPVIASVIDRDEVSLETAVVNLSYWPTDE